MIAVVHCAIGVLALLGSFTAFSLENTISAGFTIAMAGVLFYGANRENKWIIMFWLVMEMIPLFGGVIIFILVMIKLSIVEALTMLVIIGDNS